MKVTLIYNPDAGGDNQPSPGHLMELIHSAGHEATCHSCKESGWDKALGEPVDLVAVAGGDGIVGQLAKRLVGKHTPIAVLPMGTANNIAVSLGVNNLAMDELIFAWNNARRIKFDVGIAKGPWGTMPFIEGVGMGLFTETMSRLDAQDNLQLAHLTEADGKLTSVLKILRSRVESAVSHEMKITLDGRDLSGRYILLEAMNIHCIGPNFCLAPPADPGDGMIDLVVVNHHERERVHKYLSDRIDRKSNYPGLTIRRGKRLHIECAGVAIHIDDNLWPDECPPAADETIAVDLTLNSEQLEMLAPK